MSDHALLELAAKAAGYEFAGYYFDEPMIRNAASVGEACRGNCISWNPLKDDGDALRLAVDLRLEIELTESTVLVEFETLPSAAQLELLGIEPYAAVRRAITRAAAEIGRTEP